MLWQPLFWGKEGKKTHPSCFTSEMRCPKMVPSDLKIISHKYEPRTNYFGEFGVDIILSRTRPTFLCILKPKNKIRCWNPAVIHIQQVRFEKVKIIHRFPAKGKVSGFMKSFMMFNVMAHCTTCLRFFALQLRRSVAKDTETLVWITRLDFKYWIWAEQVYRLTTYKRMCHLSLYRYGKAALYSPSVNLTKQKISIKPNQGHHCFLKLSCKNKIPTKLQRTLHSCQNKNLFLDKWPFEVHLTMTTRRRCTRF